VPWYASLVGIAGVAVSLAVQVGAYGLHVSAVVIVIIGLDLFRQTLLTSLSTKLFSIQLDARARLNAVFIFSVRPSDSFPSFIIIRYIRAYLHHPFGQLGNLLGNLRKSHLVTVWPYCVQQFVDDAVSGVHGPGHIDIPKICSVYSEILWSKSIWQGANMLYCSCFWVRSQELQQAQLYSMPTDGELMQAFHWG